VRGAVKRHEGHSRTCEHCPALAAALRKLAQRAEDGEFTSFAFAAGYADDTAGGGLFGDEEEARYLLTQVLDARESDDDEPATAPPAAPVRCGCMAKRLGAAPDPLCERCFGSGKLTA
jgi:hypothetical protein